MFLHHLPSRQAPEVPSRRECVWMYLPVAPQLVALHAVAVVQRDGAVVGDGVEADLLGVHGVSNADVFPPAEREDLQGEGVGCQIFIRSRQHQLIFLYEPSPRLSRFLHTGFLKTPGSLILSPGSCRRGSSWYLKPAIIECWSKR